MIQSLAHRLNDLGKALGGAELLKEVRDRGPEIRKPDFTLERALRDLKAAAEALVGVKVYAVGRPLDWHEQHLWDNSEDFREHLKLQMAEKIGRDLLNEGSVEVRLVGTDRKDVKAVTLQAAIVTPSTTVRYFIHDIDEAFKLGVETLRRNLKRGADAIRDCTAQEGFARVVALIDSAKAMPIEAPAHFPARVEDEADLERILDEAANAQFEHGENVLAFLRRRGFDLVRT